MATWKKVIVSGSNAELNQITASGGIDAVLPNLQQANFVTYDLTNGTLGYFGTGSLTATTASYVTSSGVSGPFGGNSILTASYATTASFVTQAVSASFATLAQTANTASYVLQAVSASFATLAQTANTASYVLQAVSASFATTAAYANGGIVSANLTQGTGVTAFTYNGGTAQTVAVSGASALSTNAVTKWTGAAFANSSLTDNGTTITGATSIQLTGASSTLTGSFTGSFVGALTGTSSWASNALNANTASYVFQAVSASFATLAQTANTASFVVTAQTASYVLQAVSASFATLAQTANSASNITNAITNAADNRLLTANVGGTINGESNLTFDGTTLSVTGNATLTGNLTVAGTASFTNTDNLNIRDKFILINSGSATLSDSGWITQYNAAGSGSAFYLDAGTGTDHGLYGRFAVAFDTLGTATTPTVSEYVVTAKINQASNPSNAVPPTWGTGSNGSGNMWITNAGDIFIYG